MIMLLDGFLSKKLRIVFNSYKISVPLPHKNFNLKIITGIYEKVIYVGRFGIGTF